MSPSEPIEQANGFQRRTVLPRCGQRVCAASVAHVVHATDKFLDGRRSGPNKSSRLPAKLSRRTTSGSPALSTTIVPEVYTRSLTRGNGPRGSEAFLNSSRGISFYLKHVLFASHKCMARKGTHDIACNVQLQI